MNKKVLDTINKYGMIKSGCKVVAALSGGADSVAMTHCLYKLSKELGFTLTACHINHTLRAQESERDYRFVEQFCKERGIPLVVFREDITALSEKTSQSIETAARDRRYLRFSQCAYNDGDVIATAHTLNDSAETVIYNMIRGSGLKGIAGIPPVRDNIIRPLIECTRADIERYCEENSLEFVTDSTNLTDDYTRNKIRHSVIPVLNEIFPAALTNIKKLTDAVREDESCLEAMAVIKKESDGTYNAKIINSKPDAVKKRMIINILREYGFEVNSFRVNEVANGILCGEFKAQYAKGKYLCCKNFKIYCQSDDENRNLQESFCIDIDLNKCCEYTAAGKNIKFSLYNKTDFENLRNNHKIDLKNFIDYDKITDKVYLRQKKSGDAVKLWKRSGTKTLKKLFNEAKMTAQQKSRTLLLCDVSGIIWIEGFGAAERVHADKNTQNILLIESADLTEENSK